MSARADRAFGRRTLLHATAMGAVAGLAACLSPTLPLPPPMQPDQIGPSTAGPGLWDIRGICDPGSVVLVKNLRTKTIAGIEDRDYDGRYLLRIAAEECDPATVWEIVGTTISESTLFTIEPTLNGTPVADTCPPE